jgi:uncharacterized protein (TIGR02453 family)
MQEVIDFLSELNHNNNKNWFDEHKNTYKRVKQKTDEIALQLIDGISLFDNTVMGLTLRDCTYRIYRDIRFSNDKTPYKTHIGIYICRGGKKSGFAGYYFHIQPITKGFLSGNILCSGLYEPSTMFLKSVREEIDCNGSLFLENMNKAKNFSLDTGNKLKKMPKTDGYSFDENSPYAELIKQKDFMLVQDITNDFLLDKNLIKNILNEFKKTYEFVTQINKAVEFAIENY